MWIVKGVLLGILLFIIGGISYVGIRIAIALRQVTALTATAMFGGGMWVIGPLRSQVILAALLAAIAIGLWIMRAGTIHMW